MKKMVTRRLTLLAMLTAVSIILARLLGFYITESVRVSFEYFPIILAGVCFGPLAGAIVGGLADFMGATLLSGLGFYPPLIVGPILAGLLSGAIAKYFFRGNPDKLWKVLLVAMVPDLIANLLWGTFALSLLYQTPYLTFLVLRAPVKLVIAAVDAALVLAVYKALQPVLRNMRRA